MKGKVKTFQSKRSIKKKSSSRKVPKGSKLNIEEENEDSKIVSKVRKPKKIPSIMLGMSNPGSTINSNTSK